MLLGMMGFHVAFAQYTLPHYCVLSMSVGQGAHVTPYKFQAARKMFLSQQHKSLRIGM